MHSWYQSPEIWYLAALCLVWGFNLSCVWYEVGKLLLHSTSASRSCHAKYIMGLIHFTSISYLSGISRLILFCSGEKESCRWSWKQGEERRNDGQTGVSDWDEQQRETWFPSAQTIAQGSEEACVCGRYKMNSTQVSISAYSDYEEVPTGKAASTSPMVSVLSEP